MAGLWNRVWGKGMDGFGNRRLSRPLLDGEVSGCFINSERNPSGDLGRSRADVIITLNEFLNRQSTGDELSTDEIADLDLIFGAASAEPDHVSVLYYFENFRRSNQNAERMLIDETNWRVNLKIGSGPAAR